MFTCSACLRSAISSLASDLPCAVPSRLRQSIQPISRLRDLRRPQDPLIRTAATLRSLSNSHHRRDALRVLGSSYKTRSITGNKKRNATKGSPSYERAKQANSKHLLTEKGKSKLEIQADKEAVFLVDPLRLANTVVQNLSEDNYEKAHELVLASDRHGRTLGKERGSVNNIVSWNHLIDWLMAKKQPKEALKLYQDMKKRGHHADAHTYTAMLRGFAENHNQLSGKAVEMAMKVYNNIFQPNSKVKVSTIHTNAMMQVCAKAHDMDTLWSTAGRMPNKGPGSADHWTYTTILNAMQYDVLQTMSLAGQQGQAGKAEADQTVEKTMTDAKTMWQEIVIKWRNADLEIDEKLVSAMARLLMASQKRKHILDVFPLVRQTMGLHVSHESLKELQRSTREPLATESENVGEESTSEPAGDIAPNTPYSSAQDATIFDYVPAERTAASQGSNAPAKQSVSAKPGVRTLSILLEATIMLKQAHVGRAYWDMLTSTTGPYQLTPDTGNLMGYLRLLRLSRSSRAALELLQQDLPEESADFLRRRGPFVIAMSTCVRDKQNPNAFSNASRMLDIMQRAAIEAQGKKEDEEMQLEASIAGRRRDASMRRRVADLDMLEMDPKVLTMYLSLAMDTTKGVNPKLPLRKMKNGDLDYERDPRQNNTMRALNRLGPDAVNVLRMLKLVQAELSFLSQREALPAASARKMRLTAITGEKAEDLLSLLRTLVSAYDRVLAVNFRLEEEGLGPIDKADLTNVRIQKAKMASYIDSLSVSMRLQDPKGSVRYGLGSRDGFEDEMNEKNDEEETVGEEYLTKTSIGAKVNMYRGRQKATEARKQATTAKVAGKGPRVRPLSRRQTQERERERRDSRLRQTIVHTGKTEAEIRRERRPKQAQKWQAVEQQDVWGRGAAADAFDGSFTDLRTGVRGA